MMYCDQEEHGFVVAQRFFGLLPTTKLVGFRSSAGHFSSRISTVDIAMRNSIAGWRSEGALGDPGHLCALPAPWARCAGGGDEAGGCRGDLRGGIPRGDPRRRVHAPDAASTPACRLPSQEQVDRRLEQYEAFVTVSAGGAAW